METVLLEVDELLPSWLAAGRGTRQQEDTQEAQKDGDDRKESFGIVLFWVLVWFLVVLFFGIYRSRSIHQSSGKELSNKAETPSPTPAKTSSMSLFDSKRSEHKPGILVHAVRAVTKRSKKFWRSLTRIDEGEEPTSVPAAFERAQDQV